MPYEADNLYDALFQLVNPIVPMTADYAGQIPLPFCRYVELGETFEFFTRSAASPLARDVINHGEFQLSVFAATREQCRQISRSLKTLLDDYQLYYNDGRLMYLNPVSAVFVPEPHTGPGSPTVFHRAVTYRYNEQRKL